MQNASDPHRQKALDYLQNHNVMTLATQGIERPWAAAVFYVNEGFNLFFLSLPSSRHALNLEANPWVSATVQEDYRNWHEIKGIQLEGKAIRIEGVEQAAAAVRYGLKFPVVGNLTDAPEEIIAALGRIVWFKVAPARLFFVDNSLGFGYRDEVLLQGVKS